MNVAKLSGRRWALAAAVSLAWAASIGCARLFGATDLVSGQWVGHWYVGESTTPAGGLKATITSAGRDAWDAAFDAEFGGTARYEVQLTGRRQEGRVLFGGQVDLGRASGGVFEWTGEIIGREFTGRYTSAGVRGTFRLEKVD